MDGTYNITIRATDNYGEYAESNLTIYVTNSNIPLLLSGISLNYSLYESQPFTISLP